jgi:hypothetical protein
MRYLVRKVRPNVIGVRNIGSLSFMSKEPSYQYSRPKPLYQCNAALAITKSSVKRSSPPPKAMSNLTRSYQVVRAFPQYSIVGESSLLSIKPIMPKFKSTSNDAISLQQKGSILMEFSPANPGNQMGWTWDEKIKFALSVEEIGLLISQLPHYPVTLTRTVGGDQNRGFNGDSYNLVSSTSNETMDKVLTAEPGDGAIIKFRIDYMKDGVGGQIPPAAATNEISSSAPLEVVVEAGEWEVMLAIFKESIPHLLGWNKMMSIGVENAIQNRDD